MTLTLRKTFLLIVMALVMLMGLLGWTLRMETASPVYHSARMQSSHAQLAVICPPPPFDC